MISPDRPAGAGGWVRFDSASGHSMKLPREKFMSAQHGSPKSDVAYAINHREFASMMLVTACAIAASFIVTYSITSTFGHSHLISMTTSFITAIAVGLISIAVRPVDVRVYRQR